MKKKLTKEEVSALLDAAEMVRENSYSPFSGFKVGAAVLTQKGSIFVGTNVENPSYGLTICAERNAIFAAVAGGNTRLRALALVTEKLPGIPFNTPCGACRQVMSEFLAPDAPVYLAVLTGTKRKVYTKEVKDLLPFPFTKYKDK